MSSIVYYLTLDCWLWPLALFYRTSIINMINAASRKLSMICIKFKIRFSFSLQQQSSPKYMYIWESTVYSYVENACKQYNFTKGGCLRPIKLIQLSNFHWYLMPVIQARKVGGHVCVSLLVCFYYFPSGIWNWRFSFFPFILSNKTKNEYSN